MCFVSPNGATVLYNCPNQRINQFRQNVVAEPASTLMFDYQKAQISLCTVSDLFICHVKIQNVHAKQYPGTLVTTPVGVGQQRVAYGHFSFTLR